MSLISRPLLASVLLASTLLLAVLVTPTYAQFGDGGGGRGGGSGTGRRAEVTNHYSRYVVLQSPGGLSEATMQVVANELARALQESAGGERRKDAAEPPVGVTSIQLVDAQNSTGGFSNAPVGLDIRSLSIQIQFPSDEYDAEVLAGEWERVRERLESALRRMQVSIERRRVEEVETQRRAAEAYRLSTERMIADLSDRLEAIGDPGHVEQLRARLDAATAKISELSLDRVGVEARREAITHRIAELRRASDEASEDDALIVELEKIVAIRERQLELVRTMEGPGTTPPRDVVDAAESQVAAARVELLKAKRATASAAAGGALQELNNELSRLIVQLAEIDARTKGLESIKQSLREATSAGATVQASVLHERLAKLQGRLAEAEDSVEKLQSLDSSPPQQITITPLDEVLSLSGEEDSADAPNADP